MASYQCLLLLIANTPISHKGTVAVKGINGTVESLTACRALKAMINNILSPTSVFSYFIHFTVAFYEDELFLVNQVLKLL